MGRESTAFVHRTKYHKQNCNALSCLNIYSLIYSPFRVVPSLPLRELIISVEPWHVMKIVQKSERTVAFNVGVGRMRDECRVISGEMLLLHCCYSLEENSSEVSIFSIFCGLGGWKQRAYLGYL